MFTLIRQFKESLKGIQEILKIVVELWETAKRYPLLFIMVALGVGAYYGLRWYVFDYPKRCIYEYYHAIGARDFSTAWNYLSDDFRTKRWGTRQRFQAAYQTMTTPSALSIEFTDSRLNPLRILTKPANKYVVQYEEIERFTRDDLKDDQEWENRLWLQIAHRDRFQQLMDGTLSQDNASLILSRFFKETIVVKNTRAGWVIASIDKTAKGLK
jgi:hypothetical protein